MRVVWLTIVGAIAITDTAAAFSLSSEEKAAMINSCTQGQVSSGEAFDATLSACTCVTNTILPLLPDEEARSLASAGQFGTTPSDSLSQKVWSAKLAHNASFKSRFSQR
jgi:hypothetical protein